MFELEQIDHPPHYQSISKVGRAIMLQSLGVSAETFRRCPECIDFIEQWPAASASFHLGNAIKYL